MKLLLHICCGPCALYPLKELLCNKFDRITGFFYNPNIHPPSEYKKRKDAVNDVASKIGLEVIAPLYKMEEYFRKVLLKEESPQRCSLCWELRLSKTADFAKHNGFDAWTTTLLISPYQNHDEIKKIGEKIAKEK
ncbi:MAG: epoxyqueuosine reductase QueH, partial [Candidatus Omnitrophota bacterium]